MQPISKKIQGIRQFRAIPMLIVLCATLALAAGCATSPTTQPATPVAPEGALGMAGDATAAQPASAAQGRDFAGMTDQADTPSTEMTEPGTGSAIEMAAPPSTGDDAAGQEDRGLGIMIVNQPSEPPPVRGKLLDSGVRVYSNSDLPSIEESDPGSSAAAEADTSDQTAAFGDSWLAQRNEAQTAAQQAAQQKSEVDTRMSQLRSELDRLAQEEKSLRNPLAYPRSKVEKSDQEKSADSGLDIASRLDQIRQRREAIQAEIEKERARLNAPSQ